MKNKICGIYLITERETRRDVYVGQGVVYDRWGHHRRKYPEELFDYRILLECPRTELDHWEQHYIRVLKTHWSEGGDNQTWGGQFWPRPEEPLSPATRKKLSEAQKAYEASMTPEEKQKRSQKISEATKAARDNMTPEKKREWSQKISEGKKGIPGAPVSEETRQKLSDAGKSHWSSMTEDEKRERSQKISQSKTGKSGPPQSEETKKKRAETIRGQTRSEEAKKNMSEARKAIAARKRAAKAALEETHTSIEDDQQ
jgi:hypothetical protein